MQKRSLTPFLVLAVCLSQSCNARSQEPARRDTAQWSEEVDRFRQQDLALLHRDVVFTGSSSVRMWDLDHSFGQEFQWINRGFGGSIINDNLVFIERTVLPYTPRVVVFYAGDNDIGIHMSVADVVADFQRFADRLHAELPKTQLIYISIKPSPDRWELWPKMKDANDQINALCAESPWLHFVDIAPTILQADGTPKPDLFQADGLHFSAAGYEALTTLLRPRIKSALQQAHETGGN